MLVKETRVIGLKEKSFVFALYIYIYIISKTQKYFASGSSYIRIKIKKKFIFYFLILGEILMEDDTWSIGFSTASRSYQSTLKTLSG